MTDIADFLREQIVETAESTFCTRDLVILRVIDIAWGGWECDEKAALIELSDGRLEIVITSKFGSVGMPATVLHERVEEYRRLISDTLELLEAYEGGRGPNDAAAGTDIPAHHAVEQPLADGSSDRVDASLRDLSPRSLEILEFVKNFRAEPRGETASGDDDDEP